MTPLPRVSFEFTIDEAVDVQLGFLKASREGSSWRRREQWKFAGSFTVAIVCTLGLILFSMHLPLSAVGIVIGIVAALGLLLAIPFGWYYDHLVRKRTRRFLIEQFGGHGPHPCSIEVRPEGLWVAQRSVEMTFPWHGAKGVHDTAEGVTVTFNGGQVLARSRGFRSEDERREFLRTVQELVPPKESRG